MGIVVGNKSFFVVGIACGLRNVPFEYAISVAGILAAGNLYAMAVS
jgi:hypothetical protein